MSWVEALGYLGAAMVLGTYSMKRMVPLRVISMCASSVFVIYGLLAHVYPQVLLHGALLPLNAVRLREMLQLTAKVRVASQGDLNMEWLKPFMTRRTAKRGEVLFHKGELSSAMFYTLTGRYLLKEIEQDVGPGQVIGEIGLIAPGNKRTLTFECVEDGELLALSYAQVKQLYFQNPAFGFYFLQLTSQRLFTDIERLQKSAARTA